MLAHLYLRKYINPKPRTPSPALSADESVDSITLDPELAKIAREVQSERRRQQSMGPESRGGTPLQEGGPENVILKIKWVPHPLDDAALPQAWTFRVKRVGLYPLTLKHFLTRFYSMTRSSNCMRKSPNRRQYCATN